MSLQSKKRKKTPYTLWTYPYGMDPIRPDMRCDPTKISAILRSDTPIWVQMHKSYFAPAQLIIFHKAGTKIQVYHAVYHHGNVQDLHQDSQLSCDEDTINKHIMAVLSSSSACYFDHNGILSRMLTQ